MQLELLDAGEDAACSGWGETLPVRLRQLHSHWLCRAHGTIVLRPRSFLQHTVDYIMCCTHAAASSAHGNGSSSQGPTDGAAAAVCYDCRRVPPHLNSKHWTELAHGGVFAGDLLEQLVLATTCPIKQAILAQIEDPAFIHMYRLWT